jgi:hypothetical protein
MDGEIAMQTIAAVAWEAKRMRHHLAGNFAVEEWHRAPIAGVRGHLVLVEAAVHDWQQRGPAAFADAVAADPDVDRRLMRGIVGALAPAYFIGAPGLEQLTPKPSAGNGLAAFSGTEELTR